MSYLPDLSALLKRGNRVVRDDGEYVIEGRAVGVVSVPSGHIVGCDPLTDPDEAPPFAVRVPPGRYELRAWIAAIHRDGRESDVPTIALELLVSEQPTVQRELARFEDQEAVELGPDGFVGYPVDAGGGTLADLVAVRAR